MNFSFSHCYDIPWVGFSYMPLSDRGKEQASIAPLRLAPLDMTGTALEHVPIPKNFNPSAALSLIASPEAAIPLNVPLCTSTSSSPTSSTSPTTSPLSEPSLLGDEATAPTQASGMIQPQQQQQQRNTAATVAGPGPAPAPAAATITATPASPLSSPSSSPSVATSAKSSAKDMAVTEGEKSSGKSNVASSRSATRPITTKSAPPNGGSSGGSSSGSSREVVVAAMATLYAYANSSTAMSPAESQQASALQQQHQHQHQHQRSSQSVEQLVALCVRLAKQTLAACTASKPAVTTPISASASSTSSCLISAQQDAVSRALEALSAVTVLHRLTPGAEIAECLVLELSSQLLRVAGGRDQEAKAVMERAVQLCPDERARLAMQFRLASVYCGDAARAVNRLEALCTLLRRENDAHALMQSLTQLAGLHRAASRFGPAAEALEELVLLHEAEAEAAVKEATGSTKRNGSGRSREDVGESGWNNNIQQQGLDRFQAWSNLGMVCMALRRVPRAVTCFSTCRSLFTDKLLLLPASISTTKTTSSSTSTSAADPTVDTKKQGPSLPVPALVPVPVPVRVRTLHALGDALAMCGRAREAFEAWKECRQTAAEAGVTVDPKVEKNIRIYEETMAKQ